MWQRWIFPKAIKRLILWCHQQAWLHSSIDVGKKKAVRANHLKSQGRLLRTPIVDEARHLLDWFKEFGMYHKGMSGPEPISYTELESWCKLTMVNLRHDEVRILRMMSTEFCSFYHCADNNTREPFSDNMTEAEIKEQQVLMRKAKRNRVSKKPS